jgi:hypothetical protein
MVTKNALNKVNEITISASTSDQSITGIDSTYDVYLLTIDNLKNDTDSRILRGRVTTGGTAVTTSTYYYASYQFVSNSTGYSLLGNTVQNYGQLGVSIGNATNETVEASFWLFNFNDASQYSMLTNEVITRYAAATDRIYGFQGGFMERTAQACDGVNISFDVGNLTSGHFVLYGLKK